MDLSVCQDSTPVMSKIYATLGRKFSKKDLEEAQRMGEDIVRYFYDIFSRTKKMFWFSADILVYAAVRAKLRSSICDLNV